MAEDRWTEETVGLVAMKIVGAGVITAADACAREALAALADAGLLAAPSTAQHPRTWGYPSEPPNEVARLRCTCHGVTFDRVYASPAGAWVPSGMPARTQEIGWTAMFAWHTEFVDATGE